MKVQIKFLASALAAILLIGGSAVFVQSVAIRGISGLAVAQSSTRFNAVKDGAAGDALSSGILATGMYSFNGATFDRVRGTVANGLDVDVTRLPGTTTLTDNFANPTSALPVGAFMMAFDGTTWDRLTTASFGAVSQQGTLFNSQNVSALDTAIVVTIPAAADEQAHLYRLVLRCTPLARTTGNASIEDGLGNFLWVTSPGSVTTDETDIFFPVPLTGSVNTDLVLTMVSCGPGNQSIMEIMADRF